MTTIDHRPALFLLPLGILYLVCAQFGYGTDFDTYAMVRSGHALVDGQDYKPSRWPGYLVPEALIGVASKVGGSTLSNTVSVALGLGTLALFYSLCCKLMAPIQALFATALVGLNPVFIVASTASMDYIYALFFMLLGLRYLAASAPYAAAPFFALALGSRLGNLPMAAALYLIFILHHYRQGDVAMVRRIFLSGLLTGVLSTALYVPAFIAAGYSLGFLTYVIGDWGLMAHVARYLFKNVYLFGLLFCLGLFAVLLTGGARRLWQDNRDGIGLALVAVALAVQLMFLKLPLEIAYLLPFAFVVALLLARSQPKWVMAVLCALVASYNVFSVNLFDISYASDRNQATGASFRISLGKGYLWRDLARRAEIEQKYAEYLR
ncbi:MAG: hypothetical protein MJE12_16745 [Alphaproteobacteria bacterium]|nr:hypothetical protein [Alphaproteobacteria bacterium]